MYKGKLPIEWTRKDLHDMALKIKENPDDISLKNVFLNLIPDTGDYFNLQLFQVLKDCYYIYSGKYFHYCTLDDFIEMNLFHIYRRSFADWNPEYSLATYFRLLTRPNGIVGKFIADEMKRYSIIDSFTELEMLEDQNPDAMDDTYTYVESFDSQDEYDFFEDILQATGLTLDEYKFLCALDGKDFHVKKMAEEVNRELGTDYSLQELITIKNRIFRKLKRRAEAIRKLFNIR